MFCRGVILCDMVTVSFDITRTVGGNGGLCRLRAMPGRRGPGTWRHEGPGASTMSHRTSLHHYCVMLCVHPIDFLYARYTTVAS